ncbi:MAG: hypothetical protein IJO88_00320 [Oscillospiraceae bacterium]|nr:hypothetical protein [Oscillospiraceae bacterium]
MRLFTYQNKRRLRIFLILLALLAVIILFLCLCRFIYLQRYLVFEDGKVALDFEQDLQETMQHDTPQWDPQELQLITDEPVAQVSAAADAPLEKLSGSYITTQMLLDIDSVVAALSQSADLPDTLMLDLKSIYGNFYYSSDLPGALTSSAEIQTIDRLIGELSQRDGLYLIARVSSLSDTNFALANQSCGLPLRSGALWMSDEGCYWLDPMKETVQEYLVGIAEELAHMGFDEIVFDDFRIPDSTNIVYKSELTRSEAAAEAAKAIRERLQHTPIRVCFNSSDSLVAAHSDRVYLVTQDGSSVAELVRSLEENVSDPAAEIVFLTPSRDTRFEDYSILRPLIEERQQ